MKQKDSTKRKRYGAFMALLLVISMFVTNMGMGVMAAEGEAANKAAAPYNPEAKGTITVQLQDIQKDRENVSLAVYQVGKVDLSRNYIRFAPVDELKDTAVDLNGLTTGKEIVEAAAAVEKVIEAGGLQPVNTALTDSEGKVVFSDLEQGMYLVRQTSRGAYGMVQTLLTAIPQMEDGSQWIYDVAVSPKGYGAELGTIEVTKALKFLDGTVLTDTKAEDSTFYVGLFLDSKGTIPYGGKGKNVKPIHIQNDSFGTAVFEGLPKAIYYVYETDAEGNAIPYRQEQAGNGGKWYAIAGETLVGEAAGKAPEITIDEEHRSAAATVSNVYYDLPDGFFNVGEISISKGVTYNGELVTATDTFYAGVFAKDATGEEKLITVTEIGTDGTRSSRFVITLKQNSKVIVEVPLGEENGTESITYTVKETDVNGVPVDKETFPYTVSGEGDVTLDIHNKEAEVNITNALSDDDGYYEEETDNTESTESTESTQSGGGNSGSDTRSGSTRTSDNTPIALYGGFLAMAVLTGGLLLIRRKKQ